MFMAPFLESYMYMCVIVKHIWTQDQAGDHWYIAYRVINVRSYVQNR